MAGEQVKNGKAFEYALAFQYVSYLCNLGLNVELVNNPSYENALSFYDKCSPDSRLAFNQAAYQTIDTIIRLEPGLTAEKDVNDKLLISISPDSDGINGDVRDIVFKREESNWEIGFSAKNNNDAIKHSRLSKDLDFGQKWIGVKCSQEYWDSIAPIFNSLQIYKEKGLLWRELSHKAKDVYIPILNAFKKELLRINSIYAQTPKKLIEYLIGIYPFYKIIKEDLDNLVIVKAFNLKGKLGKKINGKKSKYKIPKLNFPTRIIEFEMKKDSDNTLIMIMDQGWEISFRLHNASSIVETSLKFDIQLIGNPPILFTQYIFQD